MGQNKIILLVIFFMFWSCNNYHHNKSQAQKILNEEKNNFGQGYNIDNLFEYFPNKISNDSVYIYSSPPACPPQYKCMAQFGDFILIANKEDYQKELSDMLKMQIEYKTTYTDDNVIINLSELKQNIFPVEKCNKWHSNKPPIPYFESYNFGLGGKETKKEVNGEQYFNYIYTIPSDLQIYVINAEAGNFWKENCNEKRPESLKMWQHGFSRGFAVSKTANIIVYWVMIW